MKAIVLASALFASSVVQASENLDFSCVDGSVTVNILDGGEKVGWIADAWFPLAFSFRSECTAGVEIFEVECNLFEDDSSEVRSTIEVVNSDDGLFLIEKSNDSTNVRTLDRCYQN